MGILPLDGLDPNRPPPQTRVTTSEMRQGEGNQNLECSQTAE
eukprot:CAMPEP_0184677576 /NCGR_PEP_ID=MMETSP0312-20130426/160_1 /TAXON_ID=31354 /ORGANISM="Compsopogon coeruleus, Strain SAG 36.94" /LENGTH=41 /DNA_ID= /DNA_START= /DNA_END= /DNA_ORIENTATION=